MVTSLLELILPLSLVKMSEELHFEAKRGRGWDNPQFPWIRGCRNHLLELVGREGAGNTAASPLPLEPACMEETLSQEAVLFVRPHGDLLRKMGTACTGVETTGVYAMW